MKKSSVIILGILFTGCGMTRPGNTSLSKADSKSDNELPASASVVTPKATMDVNNIASRVGIDSYAGRYKNNQKIIQSNPQNFSAYVDQGELNQ